jgi:pimeloyl-ACP methyl ester carboxylesterase
MECLRSIKIGESLRQDADPGDSWVRTDPIDRRGVASGKQIMLLHGSWTDGRSWRKVVPLLASKGYRVSTPDLPGRGTRSQPSREVTLQDCVDTVVDAIDQCAEPVTLVGHSRAGVVISQVAELRPDRIDGLIYIAAFLLSDGQTVADWALQDTDSLVLPYLRVSDDGRWDSLPADRLRAALYADCSEEDFAQALAQAVPEPVTPYATPLRLTEANYGRVRRSYIELSGDMAVTPALQAAMRRAQPCRQVVYVKAGHCAQFSAPVALANAIALLA